MKFCKAGRYFRCALGQLTPLFTGLQAGEVDAEKNFQNLSPCPQAGLSCLCLSQFRVCSHCLSVNAGRAGAGCDVVERDRSTGGPYRSSPALVTGPCSQGRTGRRSAAGIGYAAPLNRQAVERPRLRLKRWRSRFPVCSIKVWSDVGPEIRGTGLDGPGRNLRCWRTLRGVRLARTLLYYQSVPIVRPGSL